MQEKAAPASAIIMGAGPAGLTAAYELLARTSIRPIIIEASGEIGGICKTVAYKGNRIDFGGHRFFSKSDRVTKWWLNILPLESPGNTSDNVMLVRQRKSRIYFMRKFFDYPIALTPETIFRLGLGRTFLIGLSYLKSALFPIRNEQNLEQFFINRFGRRLYLTFFKSYTEKVWGIACDQISADWGAQRVKSLSIARAVIHFCRKFLPSKLRGRHIETSLIEQFMYPKLGPGQFWEEVGRRVEQRGGQILLRHAVVGIETEAGRITAIKVKDEETGHVRDLKGDLFFSTLPVKELIRFLGEAAPGAVRQVAEGLVYRDFITVGLLVKKLKLGDGMPGRLIQDNWIYIQEPEVRLGRMQVFNNWSPGMMKDPGTIWLGIEYFCNEGDDLWSMADEAFGRFAIRELAAIDIIEPGDVVDFCVLRMKKTYPAYWGTYDEFERIREFTDAFPNLFLIGRNGMHRYNNQDHSMLTAMVAVDNIVNGVTKKDNIWSVNTDQEYHEVATKVTAVENLMDAYSGEKPFDYDGTRLVELPAGGRVGAAERNPPKQDDLLGSAPLHPPYSSDGKKG